MYSAVQDKSANYTVVAGDAGDLIRVTTTSGAVTITLPTISTVGDGFKVAIVKWTGDANAVTVNRSSTNTINGATSATIGAQYSSTTFVADLETGQWFAASSGLGTSNVAVDAFSGNNSTTAFTLSGDPGSENNTQVYVSGVYQEKDTYSVSGTTLTFSTAPPTGTSNIEVVWTAPLAIGTPSDGTVTTAKLASTTGSGAVVLGTSPTITTPTISSPITTGSTPQVTTYTSGSGTYTVPTNCRYLQIKMVGGGGGGGGVTGNNGSVGGNTTFGTATASGGSAGQYAGAGGQGGTATNSYSGIALSGGDGGTSTQAALFVGTGTNIAAGGGGGNSAFGGGGSGAYPSTAAFAGKTNTGGGGGGGAYYSTGSVVASASGGGAGGYVEAYITSPSATYSYSVGAGGAAGAAGTGGSAGGAGGSGVIYITAFF
jgi:hypothetical protein